MKKLVFAPVFLIVLVWELGSCTKSSSPAFNPITPLQALVNNDTSLSLFHRMLLAANENGLLADNAITLLIPTNAAFRAAGYTEIIIDSLRPSVADRIVSYHFINQVALPDSNGYKPYPTRLGYSIYGQLGGSQQVWFNGGSAIDTLMVGKALIYRMNRVLLSPMDSLSIQLATDTALSFSARLFQVTGLDTTLSLSQNPYTVLAPINAAWRAAGYDSLASIDSADHNTMVELAKYHTVSGRYFSNTFTGLNSVVTLQGGSLTVGISNNVLQFSGAGNASPANVLTADQPAGNTFVIHRIDHLLSQ